MPYSKRIRSVLNPDERMLLQRLTTPQKIQDYLDTLPINFELSGETYMSPRRVIRAKTAHCFEGALFAAAALAYHGESPLLMDLQTIPADEDHVVTLFKQFGLWGAISKTNHTMLRYRDPVYESPRELAMSYFHEYLEWKSGKKSLQRYSKPYDLSLFPPKRWVTDEEDLVWLVDALDSSRHFPIAPKKNMKVLRRGASVELRAMNIEEWSKSGIKKVGVTNNSLDLNIPAEVSPASRHSRTGLRSWWPTRALRSSLQKTHTRRSGGAGPLRSPFLRYNR